jgi:hypothetical protein
MIPDNLIPEIQRLNQKYPKIDWGGCGTFSYYLSEKLTNMNIPNEIVYIPEKETPIGAHRCDIKFHHILVKVNDSLIDNYGISPSCNYQTQPLDKSKLHSMLDDKKLWNNVFPHEQWDYLAYDILNLNL